MEGEKGGDRAAMDQAWSILEEVLEVLDTRAEVGPAGTWCVGGEVPTVCPVGSLVEIRCLSCNLSPGRVS